MQNRRVLSQRSVGKLQVLLQMLFARPPQTLQLLPEPEYKRLLYEREISIDVLDHIGDRYRWRPSQFLAAMYDGRVYACATRPGYGDPVPTAKDVLINRLLLMTFAEVALDRGLSMPGHLAEPKQAALELLGSLQLDGYEYIEGKLVEAALKGVDLQAEDEYLLHLLKEINPDNLSAILHHHKEADDTYVGGNWGPASSETRNFFVAVLRGIRNVATKQGAAGPFAGPEKNLINNLQEIGFLDSEEKEAVLKIWVLLSYSGAHPGVQPPERARLTRLLVLGLTEWLCLKFTAWKNSRFQWK
jgi:hypothetical protein